MKIVAILQARCSSSRLPNKVMLNILGKPMIQQQIERLNKSKLINEIVVATSTDETDNRLVSLCQKLKQPVFRGDLSNVLDRFYQTAVHSNADIVIRLTGDCPLTDPELIDVVIKKHLQELNDYTSNIELETYPDGLDVEVMNMSVLKEAWQKATLKSEKEHVTTYIRKNNKFKKGNVLSHVKMSHYRWTVDETVDFEFVKRVYERLGQGGKYFDTKEIYDLLVSEPELTAINSDIVRNEGFLKSLANDNVKEK
jgi:spore coat polysaccharide biosynthesis protein SpsF (cytidylyltransferase family)